jgi:hypothetical protein
MVGLAACRACGITQFPSAVLPAQSQIRVIREIRGQLPPLF